MKTKVFKIYKYNINKNINCKIQLSGLLYHHTITISILFTYDVLGNTEAVKKHTWYEW